jgi:hypothetical protein
MDVLGRSVRPSAGLAVLASLLAVLLPSPSVAETFLVFGPEVYLRAPGQPVTVVTPFTVADPEAVFTLEIVNGGDDDDLARVSSAVISVNGAVVVGPEEFNQQIRRIEKPVELEAANEIAVELRSPPGSGLVIRIFGEGDGPLGAGAPVLDPHPSATAEPQIVLTGRAPDAAAVEVSSPTGVVFADLADGVFSVTVALRPNSDNPIFLTALAADGTRSAPAATTVTQDSQPPELFIDFPADGAQLTTTSIDVAGRVSDMLSGFLGLTVTVNGIPAVVDIGIGTNGTFFVPQLELTPGQQTVIEAVATDALGNTRTIQIAVVQILIPPGAPRIEVISGNGQEGQVDSLLGEPIAVRVTQGDGTPFVNKLVTFDVTRSNGRLSADGLGDGALMLQVRTDAAGEARAFWRLGSDAGCGNNRVEVTSRDVVGTTFFCATALAAPAVQINVGNGNQQRGEAGGPLPDPLVVWVSDGRNPAAGVPVTFTVTRGGGRVGGATQTTVVSGPTGHAAVPFTLGLTPGNQTVTATFPGNPNAPTTFVAYAVARGDGPTSFEGLVIDNGNRPIEGAEVTLQVNGQSLPPILTNRAGQISFTGVPAGPAKLFVNGLVATALDGVPIPPGSFPQLNFDLTLVPDAVNSLPRPVLLPPLDPSNAVVFDNTTDVELTVAGVEGLSLRVRAGSMIRADGTVPSPADPAILSLNQVHFDDVPMPMPDGAAPPFAWTLQPSGAHFDPPIQITYPNMSGLPPGAIAYFLSFNHETSEFEIVASGSVDDSGLSIVSDPGSGLSVAGWGCNCPPYSVTGECCSCGACEECVDGECAPKQGVECCDGVEYDPAVQGCCDDQLYDLETEGCCERPILSDRVYEKETLCCENGFLSQKHPITFTDWTNPLTCQNPVPTTHSSQANPGPGGTWRFEYDGCSNPISTIRACNDASTTPGALCVFDNNRCSAGSTNAGDPCSTDADCMGGTCDSQSCPGGECIFTSMDKDNPGAGDHTAFSGVPPGTAQPNHTRPSPFLACDGHDECYQTCNSDRAVCDNGMLTGMLAACNGAAAAGDPPWIVDRCLFAADAYYKVLRAAGGIAGWGPRQREVCDCCDNG